jgi:hypothetical protein
MIWGIGGELNARLVLACARPVDSGTWKRDLLLMMRLEQH